MKSVHRILGFFIAIQMAVYTGIQTVSSTSITENNLPNLGLQAPDQSDLFLPLLYNNLRNQHIFGLEIWNASAEIRVQKAEDSGAYWVRYMAFNWAEIEPYRTYPPTYHWETVDEAGLKYLNEHNLQTIGIIYHTPSWAEKIPGETCGPIAPQNLDEFAEFLRALVARYGSGSYNVKYWELHNEPDAAFNMVGLPDDSIYGCWGDETDPQYYGGDYYAEMLKWAYPAIKSIDPGAQVMLGGLLLGCDPARTGLPCPTGNFFEGVLHNGGADYFDILGYHAYPWEGWGKIMDEEHPDWINRGGVVLGKIQFLKEVMQRYGVTKPIFLNEVALVCPDWSDCDDNQDQLTAFYEDQADYVVRLYANTQTAGLMGTIWYVLEGPGFRHSGLLGDGLSPKPAYDAFQFMTQELEGSSSLGERTDYPGIRTLQFSTAEKLIWVMWSENQHDQSIKLPAQTQRVLDKYGNVLYTAPISDTITINRPVYVELPN